MRRSGWHFSQLNSAVELYSRLTAVGEDD